MEQTEAGFLALPDNPDQDPTLDWREVFGNDQPVEVEIGIGKGRFVIDAGQPPARGEFRRGSEWAAKYLRLARQRARAPQPRQRAVRTRRCAGNSSSFSWPQHRCGPITSTFPILGPRSGTTSGGLINEGISARSRAHVVRGGAVVVGHGLRRTISTSCSPRWKPVRA